MICRTPEVSSTAEPGMLPAFSLANKTETAVKGFQDYLVFISHTGHYIIKGTPISALLIPMKLAVHILRPPNSSFFQSPHKNFKEDIKTEEKAR